MNNNVPMISVIVPVHNVEKYLHRCLDSIIGQTYKALDIIIVDDGSTDGCGKICDEYAKRDSRIRVFHTENHGLSAARNVGLDNLDSKSEFICFVDSDDWIEPDMYEHLLETSKKTGADLVSCGFYKDFSDGSSRTSDCKGYVLDGRDILYGLYSFKISDLVWNKLWRVSSFETKRFLVGRIHEDTEIMPRLLCDTVSYVNTKEPKYHYIQRDDSLSHEPCLKNYMGLWLSFKDGFNFLENKGFFDNDEELKKAVLFKCARSSMRVWHRYFRLRDKADKESREQISEMSRFASRNYTVFGYKGWSRGIRLTVFLEGFDCILSPAAAYVLTGMSGAVKQVFKRQ